MLPRSDKKVVGIDLNVDLFFQIMQLLMALENKMIFYCQQNSKS